MQNAIGSTLMTVMMALGVGGATPTEPVLASLKERLPKTPVSKLDCGKVDGLCEVTAGNNLFYVDRSARYLIIGRVYDMQTRQDLTAARLLEMNPDMLVGGAARAAAGTAEETGGARLTRAASPAAPSPSTVDLSALSSRGAIVWGAGSRSVTVFSDFQCGYCRALSQALRTMDVRVIERPISVLGSRDIANQVLCSKDPEAAVHRAYAQQPLDNPGKCDTAGLDENERFAAQHGFTGTPVIVRSDGAVIEGYRPREVLAAWLKSAKS
jgi:thiol:disulfide interchange protein DsbC